MQMKLLIEQMRDQHAALDGGRNIQFARRDGHTQLVPPPADQIGCQRCRESDDPFHMLGVVRKTILLGRTV